MPYYPAIVIFYSKHIFHSYQTIRNAILNLLPFSIGDILYIILAIIILITVGKWVYYLSKIRSKVHELSLSMLQFVIIFGVFYILFVIGWGGNYYKPSLSVYWKLGGKELKGDSALIAFDRYLVEKLNKEAPNYIPLRFEEIEERAKEYYKQHVRAEGKLRGLNTKASMFGYALQHFGIQGYYNPFTGEAQVNKYLPPFMLPFVISHEMAHQAGIAAEDDANLLAYALGTNTKDPAFNYSAHFNLWLYVHGRLRQHDTVAANAMRALLNPISVSHIDTLRAIRRRYKGDFSEYSGQLYDSYLKFHNQRAGIESYNNAVVSVWALEQNRRAKKGKLIFIP